MFDNSQLEKNQCAFCKEGHWKSNYLMLNKLQKELQSEANVVKTDGNDSDSSDFSLSIIPIIFNLDMS